MKKTMKKTFYAVIKVDYEAEESNFIDDKATAMYMAMRPNMASVVDGVKLKCVTVDNLYPTSSVVNYEKLHNNPELLIMEK